MQNSLEDLRKSYIPRSPQVFQDVTNLVKNVSDIGHIDDERQEFLKKFFPKSSSLQPLEFCKGEGAGKHFLRPLNVGILFSGGPAPGKHNVVSGVFDVLKNCKGSLIGFLGGPSGLLEKSFIKIDDELVDGYRNMGGADLLGTGRTKIEKEEDFQKALQVVAELDLDGLIIVGGDDSNTNAAMLGEYFMAKGCKTAVVGIPKTIDGDLQNDAIEISFGFDTACRVYSEIIGNIARDAISAKKYYHIIKLMGRSASHIVLECALKTHPNIALIGEEIASKNFSLDDIVEKLCDVVVERQKVGKYYGIILLPEGLVEFIPEVKSLITEINDIVSDNLLSELSVKEKVAYIKEKLSSDSTNCFSSIPENIQNQLLLDRDPHGNVQLAKIDTEQLIIEKMTQELQLRGREKAFRVQGHYLGYEGRCALPSNFDASYCYTMGNIAATLIAWNLSGYVACVKNLRLEYDKWIPSAYPLCHMMTLERRKGKLTPVIAKTLVNLHGKAFEEFSSKRESWQLEDLYVYPGPMQFSGNVADEKPLIFC